MKIDKNTTVVGFADAMKQTLDIIAKRMNEQQSQINAAHSIIDNLQRQIDEIQYPTKDK
jgi:predicted transcriptional regulator|tara:strand:- start:579 stop:755 length:177 start_codon:yes stop_codon:yes gene_type:complete